MSGSLSIRHFRAEDVPEVKQLFQEVREQRKRYEVRMALIHLLKHPYPIFLTLLIAPLIYILTLTSFTQCLVQAMILVIIIVGTRFLMFWNTMWAMWRPKDGDILSYYSLPQRFFLVAILDGAVVGTVCVINMKDDDCTGELHRMFINSKYRRKGIATRLMLQCKEESKKIGYTSLTLMTTATNHKAIQFYEKAGFTLSGRSKTIEMYPNYLGVAHYYLSLEDGNERD